MNEKIEIRNNAQNDFRILQGLLENLFEKLEESNSNIDLNLIKEELSELETYFL